jgi:hypothetical protein
MMAVAGWRAQAMQNNGASGWVMHDNSVGQKEEQVMHDNVVLLSP